MNKYELEICLKQAGIQDYLYNLDGVGRDDERFCLESMGEKWHVYFSERGIKTTSRLFDTEKDACQFIYEKLIGS